MHLRNLFVILYKARISNPKDKLGFKYIQTGIILNKFVIKVMKIVCTVTIIYRAVYTSEWRTVLF